MIGGLSVEAADPACTFTWTKQSLHVRSLSCGSMEVALVRWPDDADARESLRLAGRPRLLLLIDGSSPPTPVDDLEDWIRMPMSDADLRARVEWLNRRVAPTPADDHPVLDDDGLLNTGAGWASLPPVEARLTRAFIDRYGAVVSRDALAHAGWPQGAPDRNTLDVHVLRLRRRLAPLGLAIRTVRSRGYLLEHAASLRGDWKRHHRS
jgi:DNA-binding winged helix-turn-helix (wHTH) protein